MLSFIIAQITNTCTQFLMIKRIEHRLIINLLNAILGNTIHEKQPENKDSKSKDEEKS